MSDDPQRRGDLEHLEDDGDGADVAPAIEGAASDPRAGSRPSAWLAVASLLVAVIATPFGGGIGGGSFGELLDGTLQVRTSEGWVGLADGAAVPTDRLVRASGDEARIAVGDVVLTLDDGAELGTDRDDAQVRRGSLLVEADERFGLRVGATRARGSGQWRVDVGVATRVATYRGRVELDDGARQKGLERFRQVPVRDGALEDGRRPLRYLATDTWDERLLPEAFAVDRLAERLAGSLASSHGEDPRSPAFYEAFAAVEGVVDEGLAQLATEEDDGRFGPPADVLIGVACLDALVAGTELEPRAALERVIDLRRAGAKWGLVLVEHDLTAAELRDAADRALERVEESPPPPEPEPEPDPEPEPEPEASPAEDPEPAAPSGPEPSPEPESSPAPSGPEDGDDDGGPLGPVEDVVRDTGGTVGDVVEDTGGTVGDVVEDTTDTVGDVVGGVDDLLGGSGTSGADGDGGDDGDGGLLGR